MQSKPWSKTDDCFGLLARGDGIVTGGGFNFKKRWSKKVSNDILSFGFLFKSPKSKFVKSDDVPAGIL